MAFGFGGMVVVYVYAPLLEEMVRRMPKKILAPVCLILIFIFCADLIYSCIDPNLGTGITRYRGRNTYPGG